jgi:signal transduction histidine kinase
MDAPQIRVPIPLERELQEHLAWFIRLRWLAALAIIAGTWAATELAQLPLVPLPLYLTGIAVAGYNLLFALAARPLQSWRVALSVYYRFVYTQIGLDWIALLALAYHAGGIRSPVVLVFAFHVLIGAILLSRRACFLQVAIAAIFSGLLVWFELHSLHYPIGGNFYSALPGGPSLLYASWLALNLFLLATALLSTAITTPLRHKEEALVISAGEFERSCRELEVLYQVGQALGSTLDLKRVLNLIVENSAKLLHHTASSIRLLNPERSGLEIASTYGLSAAYLDKGTDLSPLDTQVLQGQTVQIFDVSADARIQYPQEAQREGIRSMLSVPLPASGRPLGLLRIYSGQPHHFSEWEERFLKNLANLGAIAIRNARAHADLQALSDEHIAFARLTHHQLRAPLAAAQSLLDALQYAGPLGEKQRELVARGQRRMHESLHMINDLLTLAAAQRPASTREGERVALLSALQAPLETARQKADGKKIDLHVDLPPLSVLAQEDDVRHIFANLLDNAVKYTPTGGRVHFAAQQMGDGFIRAEIRDSGIGISARDQERVFQGFYRTQAAKASGETGTGMGLSIVQTLIERWGGRLELESAAAVGSCFRIYLPSA